MVSMSSAVSIITPLPIVSYTIFQILIIYMIYVFVLKKNNKIVVIIIKIQKTKKKS